jgi:dephospho-CoA kinase
MSTMGEGRDPGERPPGRGLWIGLTGGIGSGKSTVAGMLVEEGAALVDTDAIARALTAPGGAALPALAEVFGPEVIGADGALDRDRMRARVFAQACERQRLEAILHPMIQREALAQARIHEQARPGCTVVFDIPLLAESAHWRQRVDRVLVIDCTTETQIARVRARSGWPAEAVERVIAQQATREQRLAIADAVIVNEGLTLESLRQEVHAVWRRWVAV